MLTQSSVALRIAEKVNLESKERRKNPLPRQAKKFVVALDILLRVCLSHRPCGHDWRFFELSMAFFVRLFSRYSSVNTLTVSLQRMARSDAGRKIMSLLPDKQKEKYLKTLRGPVSIEQPYQIYVRSVDASRIVSGMCKAEERSLFWCSCTP